MKNVILILALAFGIPAPASECDYYKAKSEALNCPSSGYFMSFGYRYCAKFERRQHRYTPAGQKFLSVIRGCLIRGLQVKSHLNCGNVKAVAERSHVKCYLAHGFCALPDEDKLRLFWTVWPEIFDPGFSRVMNTIQHACRGR